MKIGWFTPFNARSAIGNYSEVIVQALSATDEVTVFATEMPGHGQPRPSPCPVVRVPAEPDPPFLESLGGFDLLVYNMGDYVPYHRLAYEVAMRCPGVVILHDVVLRNFFQNYCLLGLHSPEELTRLMEYSHGEAGKKDLLEVLAADRPDTPDDPLRLEHPMFLPALRRCLGVLVHSEYAAGRLRGVTHAPLETIDFPLFGPARGLAERRAPPSPGRRASASPVSSMDAALKAKAPGTLGASERVQLLTIGNLNPNKLIHAVIQAFGRSDLLRRQAGYTVIGEPADESYHLRLRTLVQLYGLEGVVDLAGWQAEERLRQALLGADVVINFRNPHFGESSASLLDSLVAGVATVVWDHGYYAEFPDDVVCKVSSEAELVPLLERLVRDPARREELARKARAHALRRFDTARYCERFRAFADKALYHKPLLRLADHVSDRLLELSPRPPEGLVERLAAEVSLFAPPRAA